MRTEMLRGLSGREQHGGLWSSMGNFLLTEMACEAKQRDTSVSRSVLLHSSPGRAAHVEGPPMEHPASPPTLASPAGEEGGTVVRLSFWKNKSYGERH